MMQLKLQNEYFISFPISTNIFFRQFCRKLSETLGVSSLLLFCQQSQILSHVTFSLMSSLSPPATLLQKTTNFLTYFRSSSSMALQTIQKTFSYTSFSTLQRKFHLCTPRKGIVSQFPNSFVCVIDL
jgi:hypothetical protein